MIFKYTKCESVIAKIMADADMSEKNIRVTDIREWIFEAVEKVPGACNPHRVRSRQIGNMYMIVLDIETDGELTLNEAHEIANNVEVSIKQNIENVYDIVVHIEPIGKHHSEEKFGLNRDIL